MDTIWKTRWSNSLANVRQAACEAESTLESRGVDERARYGVQLTIEELMSNSIKYAYDDEDEHFIELSMELGKEAVRVVLEDDGNPFDPSCDLVTGICRPVPKPSQGGLGIMMIRRICESITYQRENNRNILQVDIALAQTAQE